MAGSNHSGEPAANAVSVLLSSVVEDVVAGPLRRSRLTSEEQSLDYVQRFDYYTRFYDVFRSADGRRVIAIGPPFTDDVQFSTWPEGEPCRVELRRPGVEISNVYAVAIVTPPWPESCVALRMEARGRTTVIPVQPSLGPFFAGSRVLIAKNRNMELLWIRDWAQFHACEHGFDAVVLYDNGSDRYTPGEVEQVLRQTPGVRRVAVVDMPAPFGPIGSRIQSRLSADNYLQYAIPAHGVWRMAPQAELVMHLDIDELVVAADREAFAALLADPAASVLSMRGMNVMSPLTDAGRLPRHRDSALIGRVKDWRAGKWIAWPGALPDGAMPGLHEVANAPMVVCPAEVATVYNFVPISTGWNNEARRWPALPAVAVGQPEVRAALDRQLWADPHDIGAWDGLSIEDPQALVRWGSERLRAGDGLAALRAATAAAERDPGACAPEELGALARRAVPAAGLPSIAQMTPAETRLFDIAARSAETAIEYGVGDSTRRLAAMGTARVLTVENAPAWVNIVKKDPHVARAIADGRLSILPVRIGPVKDFGYPANEDHRDRWPEYWRAPWSTVDPVSVDLVIVDGRFRVACALNALLTGPDGLVVLIHDFWDRPWYHAVLAHATEIGSAGRTVLLTRSAAFDSAAARADLMAHAFDPR